MLKTLGPWAEMQICIIYQPPSRSARASATKHAQCVQCKRGIYQKCQKVDAFSRYFILYSNISRVYVAPLQSSENSALYILHSFSLRRGTRRGGGYPRMERRHNNVAEGCSETDCKVACTMQNELKFQSTLKKSTLQKKHITFRAHSKKNTCQKQHIPKRTHAKKSTLKKEHMPNKAYIH